MPGSYTKSTKEQSGSDLRLGQVLIDLNMVSRPQLEQALQVSQELGLPVGRVLVMYGIVSERNLQATVQLQSLLKDELISISMAKKIATCMVTANISFDEAIHKVGWKRPEASGSNKLGELLTTAGFVSEAQLDDALIKSKSSGVPFGRILVLNGVMSESLLSSALNAQILVRDNKVTKEQAVRGLRAARQRQIAVELPLIESGYYRLPARHTIRLGELLVLAGLMTENELMYAIEIGLLNKKPIGQVLIELQYIPKEVLEAALELQQQVASGEANPIWAASRLTEINHYGKTGTKKEGKVDPKSKSKDKSQSKVKSGKNIPKEPQDFTVSLRQFMTLVGVVTEQDIKKAISIGVENPHILGRMLLLAGILDESTLKSALRCYSLIREGILDTEQAFIAFNYSQQSNISVDDALQDLGVVSGGPN